MFIQEGKRVKYSEGSREGPDKGLSPCRDEKQVSQDRTAAEETGETTCGNTKDMLSTTDTQDESVSYQWLEGAALIDMNTIQKLGDPGYVGPEDLGWTMNSLFEQITGVKQLYETSGKIMQPPNMLSRVTAANPALAKAEKWWLHTWDQVRALPEHSEGGYVEGSRRVDLIFIKKSQQDAHYEEQEQKKLLQQQKQAQGTAGRTNQKREYEEIKYAPVNLLRTFSRENWTKAPKEVAIEEPNEFDKQYEAAIDREASMRTKTGTTGTARDADRSRILVLMAEQTQRMKTEGVTCVKCGTKITLDLSNPQHYANDQQGIGLFCTQCNIYLAQCDTMESACISGDPTRTN